MNGDLPVIEAVEWRQQAPAGGSQAQIFRLADGRFAIVKFAQNPQGETVLVNEFLCCQLARHLLLPINEAVLVLIDEVLLPPARQQGMPAAFSAGLACGMIRFDNSEGADPVNIQLQCSNRGELHHVVAFEQVVCRGDGRQLLMYTLPGEHEKRFAAFDYGFAFGGNPVWAAATLGAAPAVTLPANDPFTNEPYSSGNALAEFVNRLRNTTKNELMAIFMRLDPPRWGILPEDLQALGDFVDGRRLSLIQQFDQNYPPNHLEI